MSSSVNDISPLELDVENESKLETEVSDEVLEDELSEEVEVEL